MIIGARMLLPIKLEAKERQLRGESPTRKLSPPVGQSAGQPASPEDFQPNSSSGPVGQFIDTTLLDQTR